MEGGFFMSRKEKLSAETKVKIVRRCLAGEIGLSEAGRLVSVDTETIRGWVVRYAAEGAEGFLPYERNRAYSREVKLSAIGDYLSGGGSYLDIVKK